jgi:GT2 family glycosyltransferase
VIDAVVVTHNSESDLRGFAACHSEMGAFERIIVVDNASRDGTRSVAAAAGFDLLALPRNIGFGAAANLGFRRTGGTSFAVLNPDIRLRGADTCAAMSRHLGDPSVAVVGPALRLPDGTLQDSARTIPSPADLARRRWRSPTLGAVRLESAGTVPWVVGACMIIRSRAFASVGGFDPGFRLYFEDVDLCVRLAKAGFAVRYDPAIVVDHHHGAASRRGLTSSATRSHIRSAARFYRRHPRFALPHSLRRN